MARILVAFYNCIRDEENADAKPIFYEAFINGLDRAGNEVFVISHPYFGIDFGEMEEEGKRAIQKFNPEICFIFNNCFYDLSNVVGCPIVIYEVDSPRYFSNKEYIKKNPDRYTYFMIQQDSKKILMDDFGVREDHIFFVPLFSEVYADDCAVAGTNIAFIGSRAARASAKPFQSFVEQNPTEDEWRLFQNCVREIEQNPQVSPTELVYKYHVTSELVAGNLNIPEILQTLSAEKRINVLAAMEDLGLALYGTCNWGEEYYGNIKLNFSYINKKVYSVAHNQDIYNHSKIGINISHLQATSGFPWRVMDIMGSNACLVTDYHADFEKVFPELSGIIPIYDSPYEAYGICRQLLADEGRRKEIVSRCNEVINEKYRFKNILGCLEQYSGVKMHRDEEDNGCLRLQ